MELIICIGPACSGKTTWIKEFRVLNKDYVVLNPSEISRTMFGGSTDVEYTAEFQEIFFGLVNDTLIAYDKVIVDGLCHDIYHLDALCRIENNVKIKLFHSKVSLSAVRNQFRDDKCNKWNMEDIRESFLDFTKLITRSEFYRFSDITTVIGSENIYSPNII